MKLLLLILVLNIYFIHRNGASISCGGRFYKTATPEIWNCCAGHLYPKAANFYACCGRKCYNAIKQICCGNEINKKWNINTACCDGKKLYQRGQSICCGGEVFDRKKYSCCHNVPYLQQKSICCSGGIIVEKTRYANRSNCCGKIKKILYDIATDVCCNGDVQEKSFGADTKCCGSNTYDNKNNVCCDGKILSRNYEKDKCCNGKTINSDISICCGGKVQPRTYGRKHTGCCRVNSEKTTQYGKSKSESESERENHESVYSVFDKRTSICCSGRLHLQESSADSGCCLQDTYNTKSHICCGEKVYKRKPGSIERCCNGKPFNRHVHLCCGNSLKRLVFGSGKYLLCCGTEMFDRRKAKCSARSVKSLQC